MLASSRRALLAGFAALLGLAGCKDRAPAPAPPASIAPATSALSAPAASAPAPAPPPPAPIDATLPTTTPHPLDRRADCAKATCTLTHLVPDEVRPVLSDGAPMVIWEQAIGDRASLVFPRDEGVELLGVVLDGDLDLTPMDAPTARAVGGRWTGFRAPGGGVTLGGAGGKAVRVALVVAVVQPGGGPRPQTSRSTLGLRPAGPGSAPYPGLGAHLDRRDLPGAPPAWSWKVRRKRIDIVDFAARPDVGWSGGAYHARIGWEASRYRFGGTSGKRWEVDDHPAAVLDLVRYSADAALADQLHERAWESLAVIEGEGAMVTQAAEEPARPGSIVTLPAGSRHAWKPSGKAPLFGIQVYAPPGPEQHLAVLAGKTP